MIGIQMTLYDRLARYVGMVREIPGDKDHPMIQWWLSLCFDGNLELHDEVPWCSAAINGAAWDLGLRHSKSARARSWLGIGRVIDLKFAAPAFDVVILKRGTDDGPDVIDAPGHVGLYSGHDQEHIWLLGGNQSNEVRVARFKVGDVIGVRRLYG